MSSAVEVERPADKRPAVVAWWLAYFGVAILAWHAGPLTWSLITGMPSGKAQTITDTTAKTAVDSNRSRQADYAAWNLFGRKTVDSGVRRTVVEEAPETRLELELYGVQVGDANEYSGAIIAQRGKEANYFRVDAILPGNARLAAVYPDKVLLERNGAMETLSFDDRKVVSGGIEAVERPRVDSAQDFVNIAQRRLRQDPAEALSSVGLEAAGKPGDGYRFTGKNPMLSGAGLQQGDVIRSVNGHLLGDVEQDRAMLQQFYESGMVEVEVERDGAIFTISYPIR